MLYYYVFFRCYHTLIYVLALSDVVFYYVAMKRRQTVFIERREILMQRLMDAMRHGYTAWTSGAVRVERAAAMIGKFERAGA
jgi:hypothetical protein